MRGAVVLALVLFAGGASAQMTARVEEARAALEAGETDRARALFTELARSPNAREAATAAYHLATMADDALDFPAALTGYRDFLRRDPGSRFAARAQARVDDLSSHGEGDFVPLQRLERVRRDEALANSLEGIRALDRAIDTFPPGLVRAEARLLVGEGYLSRLNRLRDAARVLRALAEDPAAPSDLRSLAAERLVDARAGVGEERAGADEVRAMPLDPEVRQNAAVRARRARLRVAARWTLAACAGIGLFALAWAARERRVKEVLRAWRRPLPWAQLAILTVGGGGLAKVYDEHDVEPFVALGAGVAAVYLVASAWSVAMRDRRWARGVGGALCFAAALAVSFLAMDALDVMMLEGISL